MKSFVLYFILSFTIYAFTYKNRHTKKEKKSYPKIYITESRLFLLIYILVRCKNNLSLHDSHHIVYVIPVKINKRSPHFKRSTWYEFYRISTVMELESGGVS